MDTITTKITLKPTNHDGCRFLTSMKNGKIVYSHPNDFFQLNDFSDVSVKDYNSVLTYDSNKWTNKIHHKKYSCQSSFQNVSADKLIIKKHIVSTPKIRVKTTYTFTIQNELVCTSSLIFIAARAAGGDMKGGVAAAVKCICDRFFEVILVNYKPEQKVKKDEYEISYIIINR